MLFNSKNIFKDVLANYRKKSCRLSFCLTEQMPSWSWWRIYCGETKWGELSPHFLQCEEWLLENREECEIDEFFVYWIE